ncbi:MAG: aminotransferase class IV [Caulobacteraceae bacterium]|nr:aminotransferase class IV [Caulobacteraceae bacterium]
MSELQNDRGLLLGDGLFETLLWRDGELVDLDLHLRRLGRGCAVLGLPVPTLDQVLGAVARSLGKRAAGRCAVRITYTAGTGGRGLDRVEGLSPTLLASASQAPEPGGDASLVTVAVRRNEGSPASRIKGLAYLDNLLARREAREAGADEALMLNNRGQVACAAAANLFWFEGARLCTPALDCGVLDGTVRGRVLSQAADLGLEAVEVSAGRPVLDQARGLFLTNSLIGMRRVSTLDGRHVAPDPRFDRLCASSSW